MPTYYALVDAIPGREGDVETALAKVDKLLGVARCKERSYDFLVKFEAASFGVVDDFLHTYVRRLPGVKGVEIVERWEEYGEAVADARRRLGP